MRQPPRGRVGLIVQSGGVGAALLEQFCRLGIGISSFAAVGGKLDVSSTDMLQWWEADDTTELALLHLESFGNPRRFARTARRVSAKFPVLTVHAGRSAPTHQMGHIPIEESLSVLKNVGVGRKMFIHINNTNPILNERGGISRGAGGGLRKWRRTIGTWNCSLGERAVEKSAGKLTFDELRGALREVGAERYHHQHPFHVLMHEGKLSRGQLQNLGR